MGKKGKEMNPMLSTSGEKIRFGIGDFGCNLIWGFVSGCATIYYTDNALLSAAVVGTIMMVARLLDGVSDIIMGIIIEKTNSKWGKARPWLLWMSIPLIITFFMAFHIPEGLTKSMKIVYAGVVYTSMTAVTYTAVNLSYITLLTLFAPDSKDRNMAAMVRSLFAMLGSLVVGIISIPLLTSFGGIKSQRAWDKIAIIYSVVTLICLIITFIGVKEKKLTVEEIERTSGRSIAKEHMSLKEVIKSLLKCKYFYLSALITIPYYMSQGAGAVNVYYARDILGDANLSGIIAAVSLPTMIIAAIVAPKLYAKFGKRNMMIVGSVVTIISTAIQFLNPYNATIFLGLYAIKGFGIMLYGVAIGTLPGDVADWCEWKLGERAEGVVSSVSSFGTKVGTGVGTALVGWILAFGHYDGTLAVQATSALHSEIALMIGIPMALAIVQIVFLILWDMDKIRPTILRELEAKRRGEN